MKKSSLWKYEYLGLGSDKGIYDYFCRHWKSWFPQLVQGRQGHLIADKGLIRPQLRRELADRDLALHTPLRRNMKDSRPKDFVAQIMNIRRRIETVISQLTQRCHIQSIRAKDIWHFTSKVARKILCHTFCFFMVNSLNSDDILSS